MLLLPNFRAGYPKPKPNVRALFSGQNSKLFSQIWPALPPGAWLHFIDLGCQPMAWLLGLPLEDDRDERHTLWRQ